MAPRSRRRESAIPVTTYLANETRGDLTGESYTLVFCSAECRRDDQRKKLGAKFRDDDSYEFDETCANCGVEITIKPKGDQ